jgi:hypothetical protein
VNTQNQIVIAPPDADFVLIVSASPWLWSAGALFVLVVLVGLGAFAKRKE